MTEPEIARRCTSCGASIRYLAFFCPQCGKPLAEPKSGVAPPSTSVVTAPLIDVSPATDGESVTESTPPVGQPGKAFSETIVDKRHDRNIRPMANQPQKAPAGGTASAAGRARMQRATTLARDVEGDMIHRVQKLRHISTVVLDEAGYDPSLRFVLVAAFLFVLFLVIVLLNKLIG